MCDEDDIDFRKFTIKEIIESLKMPLSEDEIKIVGSLTDDEKLRLAELLGEENPETPDWITADSDNDNRSYDSENDSDLVGGISSDVCLFAVNFAFDSYHNNDEKAVSDLTVQDAIDYEGEGEESEGEVEYDDEDDENIDDDDDDDEEEEEEDEEEEENDDDNVSNNSNDSTNYNPYNTDPELLSRLDQIDNKLKKLNNDYSKTMEDFVRFQENDFDLKARLKDIDESLKKLSCDNTALLYLDQIPDYSNDNNSSNECQGDAEKSRDVDENMSLNTNESLFGINFSESCECSENWANVKRKYDLQIHKIEDMLEKLCETNEKNICTKNQEEMRERGFQENESGVD